MIAVQDDNAISIRSPHARGDVYCVYDRQDIAISIRSPHARGDEVAGF